MSSGKYLLCITTVYLLVGMLNIRYDWIPVLYIQIVWIIFLALPLVVPSVGKWVGISTFWEQIKK
jgi:succinate dehydrogenase hydrophobic anchor subunit